MKFKDLFAGYEWAKGYYSLGRKNEKGKMEGKALTVKQPVSDGDWKEHLEGGEKGLGVIPLREDDTCWWACLDIDIINIDHKELGVRIAAKGLPLVVARSKSGGAHLYLFLSEPVPASIIQDALEEWSADLGYGGCEVFPKQTHRANTDDIGNWLNMPYYGTLSEHGTLRYAFKDGEPIYDAEEFLEYAETRRISAQDLDAVDLNPEEGELFLEGPPCLQKIEAQGGFPEGTRNDGLFSVGVYLRKRHPDNWAEQLMLYNTRLCDPMVTHAELSALIKSIGKKDYAYRCKQPPLKSFCNRKICLRRQFGVGTSEGGGSPVQIEQIQKYPGDPVMWIVQVNGARMSFSTDDLYSPLNFVKKCADKLTMAPDPMPLQRWIRYINSKVKDSEVMAIPEEEVTELGQFRFHLRQFLTGQSKLFDKEELIVRLAPFYPGDGKVWFRAQALAKYLTQENFQYHSMHQVYHWLTACDGETKQKMIKDQNINVWIFPEPTKNEEEGDLPEFGTKEF